MKGYACDYQFTKKKKTLSTTVCFYDEYTDTIGSFIKMIWVLSG